MGAAATCCCSTLLGAVKVHSASQEMNGRAVPAVGDGVGFAVGFDGLGGEKPAVAEFLKKRQKPTLSGQRCSQLRIGQLFGGGPKRSPCTKQAVPRTARGLVELFALRQVVVVRLKPLQFAVTRDNPLKEIWRKDGTLRANGEKEITALRRH